ncbi:hypothetical protein Micbo1qcDRAFT_166806, partial [Microdochium bolleyi]
MRFIDVALAGVALCLSPVGAQMARVCDNCTNESTEPFVEAPAPWELKTERAYVIPMIGLPSKLPNKAFSPLERNSTYATEGDFLGGLGLMAIIRYSDSPVGPYDEFLVIPGLFNQPGGGLIPDVKRRISRIYVSHKYTTWNGRRNWNIPKHLARFDWSTNRDGSETVKIFPHDTTALLDESAGPSKLPFFQGTFRTIPIVGDLVQIPFSTAIIDVLGGIGIDPLALASPPLPEGKSVYGELAGTDVGQITQFGVKSSLATVGTMDMYQGPKGDQVGSTGRNAVGDEYFANFWPGMLRNTPALR